ncbi:MAG TPA: hypothetical protein DD671_03980 [Balneolaceae bacterium]|nr:hypothetical protein [Balneolaceae bacterium]
MPTNFIAVLDHHHLENSVFLTAFAKSLAKLGDRKGIVVHGDSPYTDRLIQTGMMREDARARAIKDLNKRLIGLFADQGIPTIGVHGFQKELASIKDGELVFDKKKFKDLHDIPNLLLSNLVDNDGDQEHIPLPEFSAALSKTFDDAEILLFSMNEKDEILVQEEQKTLSWGELPPDFKEESLPEEFHNFGRSVRITTATDLANWPNLKKSTIIE